MAALHAGSTAVNTTMKNMIAAGGGGWVGWRCVFDGCWLGGVIFVF